MKKNTLYSEKGVTLVELVVGIGITSIIMVALVGLFNNSNKLFYEGEEKSFNQMHMRNLVDEITKDLRYAKNLTMLKDNDIPLGPFDLKLDGQEDYKYIYFNSDDDSIVSLEHNGVKWIPKKYLEGRIDTNIDINKPVDADEKKEKVKDESYFVLNMEDESVRFKVTDKTTKYKNSNRFKLSTTVNLLNVGSYPAIDPDEKDPPKKYKGIKYKE